MKKVRKSDKPISTWFGGVDCVPSAVLVKCITMIIRVNDVSIIRMEGAKAITVSTSTICNTLARSLPFPADIPIVKLSEALAAVVVSSVPNISVAYQQFCC